MPRSVLFLALLLVPLFLGTASCAAPEGVPASAPKRAAEWDPSRVLWKKKSGVTSC
jgi:hypothetical protein